MVNLLRIAVFSLIALSLAHPSLAEEVVRIGISAPLSGVGAVYGTAVRNGFELAKADNPELSRFRFVYDDNKYDSKESLASYRKLRSSDNVDLVYLWGEPGFGSVAPVAEREKFPLFAMSTDYVPGVGKNYVIRASSDSFSLADALVRHLVRLEVRTLDLVYTEDPFFESFIAGLRKGLSPNMKIGALESVLPESQDFRTIISKFSKNHSQAVAVLLLSGQSWNFFRQAEQLKLSAIFVGTDVFESREEISQSGPKLQGAVYPIFATPDWFREAYLAKYKNDSQLPYGYLAYAFAQVLPKIIPIGQSRAPDEILRRTNALDLIDTRAMFSFKNDPVKGMHFEFPVVLKVVHGDTVRVLGY